MIHNLVLLSQTPLLETATLPFTGMAFFNHYLYLTSDRDFIIIYDVDFNFISSVPTQNAYNSICFDHIDCCFWATVKNSSSIYKLNPFTFFEMDSIRIKGIKNASISFDCHSNNLIFTTSDHIFYSTKGGIIITTYHANPREINSASCFVNGSLIKTSYYIGCDISLFSILHDNFSSDNINCLPRNCVANSMVSIGECCDYDLYLFVLTTKFSKYSNIVKYLWCKL